MCLVITKDLSPKRLSALCMDTDVSVQSTGEAYHLVVCRRGTGCNSCLCGSRRSALGSEMRSSLSCGMGLLELARLAPFFPRCIARLACAVPAIMRADGKLQGLEERGLGTECSARSGSRCDARSAGQHWDGTNIGHAFCSGFCSGRRWMGSALSKHGDYRQERAGQNPYICFSLLLPGQIADF